MIRLACVLSLALAWATGCCRSIAPENRDVALRRVNENLAQINQPIQCKGLVSFKFRDADGRVQRVPPHDHSLIFQPPQLLRFDVRSTLAGEVAQFGSNEETYWLWTDVPDVRKLWWGTWANAERGQARRLAIPPNDLLDALMLRPLPDSLGGGAPPTLEHRWPNYWLVFARPSEGGGGTREIRLDRCAPYQPREVIDRAADGRTVMHAKLKSYVRVGKNGPYIPSRYVVRWPLSDAEIRLDIYSCRSRPELPREVFDFDPDAWQGPAELLDDPTREMTLEAEQLQESR